MTKFTFSSLGFQSIIFYAGGKNGMTNNLRREAEVLNPKPAEEAKSGVRDVEGLITYADVSELTKIKIGTLRKYVLMETMPFVKVNGFVRFKLTDIKQWFDENTHKPAKPKARAAGNELFARTE
jgi:hypothetical protein